MTLAITIGPPLVIKELFATVKKWLHLRFVIFRKSLGTFPRLYKLQKATAERPSVTLLHNIN